MKIFRHKDCIRKLQDIKIEESITFQDYTLVKLSDFEELFNLAKQKMLQQKNVSNDGKEILFSCNTYDGQMYLTYRTEESDAEFEKRIEEIDRNERNRQKEQREKRKQQKEKELNEAKKLLSQKGYKVVKE